MAIRKKSVASPVLQVPPARPGRIRQRNEGVLELARLLPEPVFWVFAGGGAHGAVQLGSLQAIKETDAGAEELFGSSAGALTAAMLAEDPVAAVARLTYLWADLDFTDIVSSDWTRMISAGTLLRGVSLSDSSSEMASLAAAYQARDFSELMLPLNVMATDIDTGQPTIFRSGELLPALLASSAIPGVFPPVKIHGRWYMDALASANLAASVAMRKGAGSIVAFDTGSSAKREVTGTSLQQTVPAINSLLSAQQRQASLMSAGARVPVVYLPTPTGLAGALSFKNSLDMARTAYEMATDFLIDLIDQYQDPLEPGVYTRPGYVSKPGHSAAVVYEISSQTGQEKDNK